MANFVSYENATTLMTDIGNKIKALGGAYILRGSVKFANLPDTLTKAMTGYVYNITEAFTTDARFIEGAGKKYKAGVNVAVADLSTYDEVTAPTGDPSAQGYYELVEGKYVLSTDTTVDADKTYYTYNEDIKFDVIGSFVDVDAITNRIDALSASITDRDFDDTADYEIGDIVKYEDRLYTFNTAHTAGEWDASEVDETNILALIADAEPDDLTPAQVNSLIGLLN